MSETGVDHKTVSRQPKPRGRFTAGYFLARSQPYDVEPQVVLPNYDQSAVVLFRCMAGIVGTAVRNVPTINLSALARQLLGCQLL